jgi:hypothetical protein
LFDVQTLDLPNCIVGHVYLADFLQAEERRVDFEWLCVTKARRLPI